MGAHFPGKVPRRPPQGVSDGIGASVMGASGVGMAMESLCVASKVTISTGAAQESQGSGWEGLLFAVFSIGGNASL